jgi:hypothetical protein
LDIERIVTDLKRERDRLSRAIAALDGIDTSGAGARSSVAAPSQAPSNKKRRGGITAAGRRRLSEAMKKRWAERRKGAAAPSQAASHRKKRGGITAEGRRRLSEAMKKRWAERRKKG